MLKSMIIVHEFFILHQEYASNEDEKLMIDKYVESFKTGSLEEHKNGSRHWIRNKSPIIETSVALVGIV